ncbi:MAG: YigZ family protein [Clostridia bacterium]|nr:YigZ family protein [Clostridia bacterium]
MESYTTVRGEGVFEYEEKKSVFIGTCVPVSTEERALEFLAFIKRKYPDARHHVYAYVLRENSIMRFSDDREPQGTAGMPVLDAIRKRGCTDVAIVVIRYFGGTLLGTGGLVRAYSAAAVGALEAAEIITYDIYAPINVTLSYSDYQKLTPILSDYGYRITDTEYSDLVTVKGRVKACDSERFVKEITESTSGRAQIEILEEIFDF